MYIPLGSGSDVYSGSASNWGSGSASSSTDGSGFPPLINHEEPDHAHDSYYNSEEEALWFGVLSVVFICILGILIAGAMWRPPARAASGEAFARLL